MTGAPHSDRSLTRTTNPPGAFGATLAELIRGSRWLLVPAGFGAVAAPTVAVIVHHLGGPLNTSAWEFVGQPARWLLFATGVAFAIGIPVVIAHGITRRTLTAAGAVHVGLLALASAVYLTIGYLVERVLYAHTDLPQQLGDGHLFTSADQVHLVLVEYTLVFAGYLASGWLVTVCYYRWGGWWGTLGLPLTLLPIVGVEASLLASTWVIDLFSTAITGERYGGVTEPLHPLLRIGLAAAVVLATLGVVRLATRRLPLRPPGA